ncbi:DUF1330 domain-containing protein [Portibacter lacus]|uniref:DUF1330 domain-containing protein n=1 Tax=Portibacter lacus TaxID=1099794 RepID=A0AA37WED9_9BACT|nr:DUF1330 domain-containing protein [Portibacter lacus]GLR18701.1 DUF1330 domain-containing protein [Portibacter lacus]
MKNYIDVTPEMGKAFYMKYNDKGKVTMLNLLRFKEVADYDGLDEISPAQNISGKEAYDIYMEKTMPFLNAAGSKVIYYGESRDFIIGPEDEKWDRVLLVEHESVAKFMEFANNKAYLKIAGHRTAALSDSRLLPSIQTER